MQVRLKDRYLRAKNKLCVASRTKRHLRDENRHLRKRCAALEDKVARLERITQPIKVAHHTYPAQVIAIAVFVVIHGGSLRLAARVAKYYADAMGWSYNRPGASSVRIWTQRCGLHVLGAATALTGKMVGIVDESIQIGQEKLILLLGVESSRLTSRCAPLTASDVHVLGVEVQSSWTGEQVKDFVERMRQRCSQLDLCYIISDRGTSLLSAIKQLGVDWVSDCSHEMMNIVKTLFKDRADFQALRSDIGKLRKSWLLTRLHILLPPSMRSKDRFLRLFDIVRWVEFIEQYRSQFSCAIQHKLSFIHTHKAVVQQMKQVRDLLDLTARQLKCTGLHPQSLKQWQAKIAAYKSEQTQWTAAAEEVIERITQYFLRHDTLIERHGQLLCCSDIIESTFGHYKNKGGMKVISADVLQIPLYNQSITPDFVVQALRDKREEDLMEWQSEHICHNFYGHRKALLKKLKNGESIN